MIQELKQRQKRTQKLMAAYHIDGILILDSVDLFYYGHSMQLFAIYIPADKDALVFYRSAGEKITGECPLELIKINSLKEIPAQLTQHSISLPKRLGFEYEVVPVALYKKAKEIFSTADFVDASQVIAETRMLKSDYEIAAFRECGKMVHKVYSDVKNILHVGMSELEVAREIEYALRKESHLGPCRMHSFNLEAFYGHVLSGSNGNIPSSLDITLGGQGMNSAFSIGPGNKKIAKGEAVVVDYLCNYNGYHIDTTRVYVIGSLPDVLAEQQENLTAMYNQVKTLLKPGAVCEDIYYEIENMAKERGVIEHFMGYREERAGFLGHAIGLETDEYPAIAPKLKQPLAANMTIAVEPKLFFPPYGLIGLEDTFLITENGCEDFAKLPPEVFVI